MGGHLAGSQAELCKRREEAPLPTRRSAAGKGLSCAGSASGPPIQTPTCSPTHGGQGRLHLCFPKEVDRAPVSVVRSERLSPRIPPHCPRPPGPGARGQLSEGPRHASSCPESHHPEPLTGLEDAPCTQAPGFASILPLLGCPRCPCPANPFSSFRAQGKGLPQEAVPEPAGPSPEQMCPASPRMHAPSHTCTRGVTHIRHTPGSVLSGDRDGICPRARGSPPGWGTLMRRGSQ